MLTITLRFLFATDLWKNSPALWTFVVEFLFYPGTKRCSVVNWGDDVMTQISSECVRGNQSVGGST